LTPLKANIIPVRHLVLIDTNSSPTNLALQGEMADGDVRLLYPICCIKRGEQEGEMAKEVIY
jgi:hypothetical protein